MFARRSRYRTSFAAASIILSNSADNAASSDEILFAMEMRSSAMDLSMNLWTIRPIDSTTSTPQS